MRECCLMVREREKNKGSNMTEEEKTHHAEDKRVERLNAARKSERGKADRRAVSGAWQVAV